jgi:hypothetical protein
LTEILYVFSSTDDDDDDDALLLTSYYYFLFFKEYLNVYRCLNHNNFLLYDKRKQMSEMEIDVRDGK